MSNVHGKIEERKRWGERKCEKKKDCEREGEVGWGGERTHLHTDRE